MNTYMTRNGLTMIESLPYNWQLELNPYGRNRYATISVGNFGSRHLFIYDSETKIVKIEHSGENSGPCIMFTVHSLEDAGELVKRFVTAMNKESDMEETIYTNKMQ